MIEMATRVVLFDGVCNLCNGAVQFLIRHDKRERLKFASLQSTTGQKILSEYGLPTDQFSSFIYVTEKKCYQKSDAVLAICKEIGGWFKLLTAFYVVPKPIRNLAYSWVANHRYKWFGKQNQCMVPTPELKRRFLE
jgi:predicted DCC family thiol-disulfide oxidoreductase YuxK